MALIADVEQLTDEEFGHAAFGALTERLGPAGFARFLRLYCSGKGNYTEERHAWLDALSIDDVRHQIASERT